MTRKIVPFKQYIAKPKNEGILSTLGAVAKEFVSGVGHGFVGGAEHIEVGLGESVKNTFMESLRKQGAVDKIGKEYVVKDNVYILWAKKAQMGERKINFGMLTATQAPTKSDVFLIARNSVHKPVVLYVSSPEKLKLICPKGLTFKDIATKHQALFAVDGNIPAMSVGKIAEETPYQQKARGLDSDEHRYVDLGRLKTSDVLVYVMQGTEAESFSETISRNRETVETKESSAYYAENERHLKTVKGKAVIVTLRTGAGRALFNDTKLTTIIGVLHDYDTDPKEGKFVLKINNAVKGHDPSQHLKTPLELGEEFLSGKLSRSVTVKPATP